MYDVCMYIVWWCTNDVQNACIKKVLWVNNKNFSERCNAKKMKKIILNLR